MGKFFLSCGVCVLLFVLPIVTFISDASSILKNERRAITTFPSFPDKISVHQVKEFFLKFDKAFADHFPQRKNLLSLSLGLYEITQENIDLTECYRGKDGWLFLGNKYAQCVDKLEGIIKLAGEGLQKEIDAYVMLNDMIHQAGSKLAVFIGPNKSSIYAEFLPAYLNPASVRYVTPLVEGLHARGVTVYDPVERLLKKKEEGLLYFRTDTHWNLRGAFEAFEGFRQVMHLPPLPSLDFAEGGIYSGDLVGIGGFQRFLPASGDAPELHWRIAPARPVSRKTAWIFADSFGEALRPYMTAMFTDAQFYKHADFTRMLSSPRQKPDLIVWIMVERNFGQPGNMKNFLKIKNRS